MIRKNESSALASYPLFGGAQGQGQLARANGEPITSNPWHSDAARAEWEAGWQMEDDAREEARR